MRERSRYGSMTGDENAEAPLYDPYLTGTKPRARSRIGRWLALGIGTLVLNGAVAVIVWRATAGRADPLYEASGLDEGTARDDQALEPPAERMGHDPGDAERVAPQPKPRPLPPSVPRVTSVHDEGHITVVDVGASERSLPDALREQQRLADQHHEKMLLMVTAASCQPCRGVDAALADTRMQKALEAVRLVRVDLEVFAEELDQLHLPHDVYPGFFLLDRNLSAFDGIHGGEWDADVAENIAPVLGPFVRGAYRNRRHAWQPSSTGIEL